MANDDEAARKARADRLRAQIRSSKKPAAEEPAPDQSSGKPAKPESPREFVERRMRELREEERS
jgi:hypothetical protein